MKRRIEVKLIDPSSHKEVKIYPYVGENLMDAFERNQLDIGGECGKNGTCGKCLVRVIEGMLNITAMDKKILSSKKLSQGYRLACMAYPNQDCTLMLMNGKSDDYKAVTKTINYKELPLAKSLNKKDESYFIAIDIGTTTLALVLANVSDGSIVKKYTTANPQRLFGADVISRIKASNEGKGHILKTLIRNELLNGINTLVEDCTVKRQDIRKIVISGNTAMIHLFMGYPCDGLGTYPFTPYKQGLVYASSDEIFDIEEKIPLVILPGISVFVGGDITAGLMACSFYHMEKPCLFIDLGTNGEIALGNKEKILVTSTSAGPAFEGGNISCGVGSIPGAICHVSIRDGSISYETIDGAPPVGLCGTGIIELTSQLLKEGIIDSSGLLIDEYFDKGFDIGSIKFLQEDIRKLQLAKAAIRAGVQILIDNYGITYEQLDRVYIAGGFGYYLDIIKAIDIGLLPQVVLNKTEAVGNTALSGAILAAIDSHGTKKVEHIVSVSEEIHLSNEKDFNDLFIRYISF